MLIDRNAHLLNSGFCPVIHFSPVERVKPVSEYLGNQIAFLWLAVEKDVLCRVKSRDQRKLLVHHSDSGSDRLKRRCKRHLLPVDQDISAVAACRSDIRCAKEDLHERRFSRSILSDKAEDFALLQLQVDICQHLIAKEVLFNVPHLKKRRFFVVHNSQICLPVIVPIVT